MQGEAASLNEVKHFLTLVFLFLLLFITLGGDDEVFCAAWISSLLGKRFRRLREVKHCACSEGDNRYWCFLGTLK